MITLSCENCCYPFKINKKDARFNKKCSRCIKDSFKPPLNKKEKNFFKTYKSGKMSKICPLCKNAFVLPVALNAIRKTCYDCYKSSKNN